MGTLEEEGETEDGRRKTEAGKSREEGEKGSKGEEVIHKPERPIPATRYPTPLLRIIIVGLVIVAVVAGGPPLARWQRTGEQRARSLSNMRRLADAWQLYAQDWDGCPPQAVERRSSAEGDWLLWPRRLGAYSVTPALLDNPANPVSDLPQGAHDPARGFPVETSYALNHRFWDTFAPGPFPVDNLELPAQTALFVEAGPMSAKSRRAPQRAQESRGWARLEYGDTTDRVEGLFAHPSTHDGKLAVVAADGHAVNLRVEHYTGKDGPRDLLYGRIGNDIYNWNGGHPNGDLDHPPVE